MSEEIGVSVARQWGLRGVMTSAWKLRGLEPRLAGGSNHHQHEIIEGSSLARSFHQMSAGLLGSLNCPENSSDIAIRLVGSGTFPQSVLEIPTYNTAGRNANLDSATDQTCRSLGRAGDVTTGRPQGVWPGGPTTMARMARVSDASSPR